MPLIKVAGPGIALPDREILCQLIAKRGTEKQLIDMAGIVQICKARLDFHVSKKIGGSLTVRNTGDHRRKS